jgi:hypothetical protein
MILALIFLVLVFLFSLVSGRAEKSLVTGPMIFAVAGLLLCLAVPEVLLSVPAHGVSANPAIRMYAGRMADLEPGVPEYA